MKVLVSISLVGTAIAHTPHSAHRFEEKAIPPTYDVLSAIGESFHNAWRHCYSKTSDWIITDLGICDSDPTFNNEYYKEYNVVNKVPRVYEIFGEFLGTQNFWGVPVFTEIDGPAKF
jgi:hypothetical protein